jgi:hypothetical protein
VEVLISKAVISSLLYRIKTVFWFLDYFEAFKFMFLIH